MARALITGCSTGIGRATAVELTKRGYDVVATARRPETLDDLDVAVKLQLDVDDDASVRAAVDAAGDVDVLVNNAGWGVFGPIEKVPLDKVRAMFETNVFGVLRMTQAVVPRMRERGGGTIVNISSGSGRFSTPLEGAYSATKHALEAISEALYYELGHFGIRVAVIEPGEFNTAWAQNEQYAGIDGPPYKELYEQLPMASYPNADAPGPELVARAIAEAIETDEPRRRWPVNLSEQFLQARAQMDDATFEQALRSTLGLKW
jgi:NAD(P)-dependent dehydrogenase (short-subunit alcohol dehydrogenase family)